MMSVPDIVSTTGFPTWSDICADDDVKPAIAMNALYGVKQDQSVASRLAMTQLPSTESTMDSLPSIDSWQSGTESGAMAGAYFVPVLITAPCVPEQMSNAVFSTPNAADQRQIRAENPPPEWGNTTTVMMRNLPNKYAQHSLLADINAAGFIGTFDFLYLPIDTETNANKGYAFVNFSEPGFAWMFKQTYEGQRMPRFNSDKVVSVFAATLQGFDSNYAFYANSRVNRGDPACRPLFLREPSANLTVKPIGRSSRRNGRGHRSNLDQLAETQDLQRRLESAVQAIMKNQQTQQEQPAQQVPQQQMRFCPHCGSKTSPDFKFCPGCGSSQGL